MSTRVNDPSVCALTVDGDRAAALAASPPAGTLYELLFAQAQRDPNAVAILTPGRPPLGFGALLDQIGNIRNTLNSCGLGRGDRIALLAVRGPETAVAALGIACCATCVPLNAAATPAELEGELVRTGAKALLVPESASSAIKDLARVTASKLLEYYFDEGHPAGQFRIHRDGQVAVAQDGWATASDIAFVSRTSGTTAQAKIVPLSHRNIVAWTDKAHRLYRLSAADRCLSLMPLCYSAGLNSSLIVPLSVGCAVICLPAFDVEHFLSSMREFAPTWYSAGFTYQQAILEWLEQRPDVLAGHRLRFVRAGSGPLPARVRIGLEEILGAPVIEVYSATEVGSIAANPPEGRRKPGTVGISPDDDVAIVDPAGNFLERGFEGEVVVRGPGVFAGYENDPTANQNAFFGEWFRTGDYGAIDADGYIKLIGRLDDIINRGGEKIAPREVDEALLTHDAVAEAVCFPVPHPTLHQEVASAVILQGGAQVSGDELRRFLAKRLASFKVPRVILCVAELPRDASGKLSRKNLATHFGASLNVIPSYQVEPITETQKALLTLWRDVLKRQDIGCDDDFFLYGGDSLSAVDLLHRIEETLQYQLPVDILNKAPTVRQLAERLDVSTVGAINDTIQIHTAGSQRPLFTVAGTGGRASYLSPVLRSLGSDQPCYGLQPPRMDWGSIGVTTLPEIAEYYVGVVKALQPHGPYRLFGHSFGGLVVYEMALQLQRIGEEVEFLGMVDTNPPICLDGGGAGLPQRRIKDRPAEPIDLRMVEAHWRASHDYTVDSRLDRFLLRSELTYFYCMGEPMVGGRDRRGLWQSVAQTGFRLLPLPGMHGWSGKGPQYEALPQLLRACLNGEPLTTSDPATVFGRSYRMESGSHDEMILSSTGEAYRVDQSAAQGYVDTFTTIGDTMRFAGWAVEPCQRQPANTIAVFLGDQFVGYGGSGISRPDIAQHLSAASLEYAGFDFKFWRDAIADAIERPRLFVLSGNGCAAELRLSAMEEATSLRAKLTEDGNIRKDLEMKCADLAAQIDAMKNSTSWRITEPVRQLRRLMAKIGGR